MNNNLIICLNYGYGIAILCAPNHVRIQYDCIIHIIMLVYISRSKELRSQYQTALKERRALELKKTTCTGHLVRTHRLIDITESAGMSVRYLNRSIVTLREEYEECRRQKHRFLHSPCWPPLPPEEHSDKTRHPCQT